MYFCHLRQKHIFYSVLYSSQNSAQSAIKLYVFQDKPLENDDNELLKLGLVKTYEGELLPEFKNMNFAETGGKTIPSNKVNSIIFKKVN